MKLETFILNRTYRRKIALLLYRDTLKQCKAFKDDYSSQILLEIIQQTYRINRYQTNVNFLRENFMIGRSVLQLFKSANIYNDENQIKKILRIAHNWSNYIKIQNQDNKRKFEIEFNQNGLKQYLEDDSEQEDFQSIQNFQESSTQNNMSDLGKLNISKRTAFPWQRILQQSKQFQNLDFDKQLFVHQIIEKCIEPQITNKRYRNLAEYIDDRRSENTESRVDYRDQFEERELIIKIQDTNKAYQNYLGQIFHLEKYKQPLLKQNNSNSEVYQLFSNFDFILPFQFPTEIEGSQKDIKFKQK
ncbi:hypothetical protein TTHERM_000497609 (macronuclear) [Tetrahymena thermophila SB210]|uniref:LYR motif-containing protein Cup1-like N-terminal domain-containing protein n=1 Tax=Tetrahymena thermophila (strain SB210) TaxID=312017 RepID=W7X3F1_TETTS|nr:hypothetical protein TTHERM_000497609 [Tetrahymena thermophila SB210]EWS70953.1 hypothetical protein TTHERM_000497609 [Tetrahymena thermophila SB210]|eukprot:XP_012656509.1 hypothetical protein TTHERM_000497609 [Tetrahymena thermophila SB210]